MASRKKVPGGIGGNPNFGTTMHRQSKAKHAASQVDVPSRVVENPYSEAALRGQNKTLEKEYTTKMSRAHDLLSTSKTATRPSLFADLLNPIQISPLGEFS